MPNPSSYAEYLTPDLPSVALATSEASASDLFPNGIPRSYDRSSLEKPLARKVIQLSILGYKTGEIARMVEMDVTQVSVILNHPDAKALINEATKEILSTTVKTVKASMVANAGDAFKTMITLMKTAKNERVRLEASRDILKGAGVLDEKNEAKEVVSPESARIIAEAFREVSEDVEEFAPLENGVDLKELKARHEEELIAEELAM